jgi:hypothetical protein
MKSAAVEFTTTKSTSVDTTAIVESAGHAAAMETATAAGHAAAVKTAAATKATAAPVAATTAAATSQRHRWRNQANGRNCQ